MALLGIDVDAAAGLSVGLQGWRAQADDVVSLIMQAEALSGVPCKAASMLDQIGSDGAALAASIRRAVGEMTAFRIAPFMSLQVPNAPGRSGRLTSNEQARAEAAAQRIRDAVDDGRAPNLDDYRVLRELSGRATGDAGVVQAALVLIARGYPAAEGLRLQSQHDVGAVYDRVSEAIKAGESPAESGLAPGLFPVEYQHWADTGAGQDKAITLVGLGRDGFVFSAGEVSGFAATTAVAKWAGPTAATWLGSSLAPMFESDSNGHVARIGEVVSGDDVVAVAFFNELGPAGTAAIPHALSRRGSEFFDGALADYSGALANVSGSSGLAFDGAALIESHAGSAASDGTPGVHPEMLLLASGYDEEFLLGAVTASLQLGPDYRNLPAWATDQIRDRRVTALQGALNNDMSANLVRHLAAVGLLGLLLDPTRSFSSNGQQSSSANGDSPISELLGRSGADPEASTALVEYLYDRGQYAAHPLMQSFSGEYQAQYNAARSISDDRIVTGLSRMLVLAATDYQQINVDPGGVTSYVDAQLQTPYFAAYHTVLLSGSGDHLFHATAAMLDATANGQLAAGQTSLDLAGLAGFVGTAHAVRHATHLTDATLTDQAATDFARDLSLIGIAAGFANGHVATAVSTAASGLSLVTGSKNSALAVLDGQLGEVLQRSLVLRRAGWLAIFGTGLVRTAGGQVIRLSSTRSGKFRLLDEDGFDIPLGDGPARTYSFNEPPPGSLLQGLTVNGEDLTDFLSQVEAANGQSNYAQLIAGRRLVG